MNVNYDILNLRGKSIMINILFVCTGDTCRSTMASAIMKSKIKDQNIKGIICSSAGLFVGPEVNMNDNAKKALKILNIKVPRHKATQLTEDRLKKYRFVLTMTQDQKQTILNRFPEQRNVFSIKEFVGAENVGDPYGKGEAEYFKVAKYLELVVKEVLKKLNR